MNTKDALEYFKSLPDVIQLKKIDKAEAYKYEHMLNILQKSIEGKTTDKKKVRYTDRHEKFKTPIGQYDLDGNLLKTYSGIRDAARAINKNSSGIVFCVNGDRQTAYGYKWNRLNNELVNNVNL